MIGFLNDFNNQFIDEYGLLHPKKGVPSENGILFRAHLDLLCVMQSKNFYLGWQEAIGHTSYKKIGTNKIWYQANPPQKGPHFSRDNMIGLYAMHVIHGISVGPLPIFRWNNRTWLHPNGWAVFLSYKRPWLKKLLYPLVYLMAWYSLMHGKKEDTSGVLLWFLALSTLGSTYARLLDRADKKRYFELNGESLFFWSYEYYFSCAYTFNNWDNPIYKEIKGVF